MSLAKSTGPLLDPALCRCCRAIKKCRILTAEYTWTEQKEVYADMIMDCFGILLSHVDDSEKDVGVCATCVVRLRDACAFRQQVLVCEQIFLSSRLDVLAEGNDASKKVLDVDLKKEPKDDGEVVVPPSPDHSADEDYKPLKEEDNSKSVDGEDPRIDDSFSDSSNSDKPLKKMKKPLVKKTKKISKSEKVKAKSKVEPPRSLPNRTRTTKTVSRVKRKRPKEKGKEDGRKALEEQIRRTAEAVKRTGATDESPKRQADTDDQKLQNAITLINNSYICPFNNSFSDYLCFYCKELHTDTSKLREHTLTHDTNTFAANVTKKWIHVDITRVDCRLCVATINNIDDLKKHLTTEHGKSIHNVSGEVVDYKLTNNNLTCIQCGEGFKYFHALKLHMAKHYGHCICDVCGTHFYEERVLYLHLRTHYKSENKAFLCSECGKTFRTKHSRDTHISYVHMKEPTYECHTCDQVFFSYARRLRHYATDHGLSRTSSCDLCDKVYDSRKSLREHTRRTHAKIFKHQCDLCDKRFYLPCRLREHLVTHSGERNFRCDLCGKTYPRLRSLKVHMQSHSADKRFKCALCSASFTQNVNLRNHVSRQHQTEYHETV